MVSFPPLNKKLKYIVHLVHANVYHLRQIQLTKAIENPQFRGTFYPQEIYHRLKLCKLNNNSTSPAHLYYR